MLRKCTAQEDSARVAPASLTHQENHILAALQVRLQLAEIIFIVDRLLVHLEDHVAASQANVFGEGVRFHVLDNHAFSSRRTQPISQVTREWLYGDAELALGRLLLVVGVFVAAKAIAEELGTI